MKKSAVAETAWLNRARAEWKSKENPLPDAKWSVVWINKFLGYLEPRNGGKLPEECPSWGVVGSFLRFIEEKWECDDWKVEQAGKALDWFGVAAGFGGMLKIWYPKGCEGRVVLLNR